MKRRVLVLLTFASACMSSAKAQDSFAVGTARAARGQTATGMIEVPAGSDAALNIPVAVVHGAMPGKTLGAGFGVARDRIRIHHRPRATDRETRRTPTFGHCNDSPAGECALIH